MTTRAVQNMAGDQQYWMGAEEAREGGGREAGRQGT